MVKLELLVAKEASPLDEEEDSDSGLRNPDRSVEAGRVWKGIWQGKGRLYRSNHCVSGGHDSSGGEVGRGTEGSRGISLGELKDACLLGKRGRESEDG